MMDPNDLEQRRRELDAALRQLAQERGLSASPPRAAPAPEVAPTGQPSGDVPGVQALLEQLQRPATPDPEFAAAQQADESASRMGRFGDSMRRAASLVRGQEPGPNFESKPVADAVRRYLERKKVSEDDPQRALLKSMLMERVKHPNADADRERIKAQTQHYLQTANPEMLTEADLPYATSILKRFDSNTDWDTAPLSAVKLGLKNVQHFATLEANKSKAQRQAEEAMRSDRREERADKREERKESIEKGREARASNEEGWLPEGLGWADPARPAPKNIRDKFIDSYKSTLIADRLATELGQLLKEHGPQITGPKAQRLDQLAREIQIQQKNIDGLGVIAGPDMTFLEAAIQSPVGFKAYIQNVTGIADFSAKVDGYRKDLRSKTEAAGKANGIVLGSRKKAAAPGAAPAAPSTDRESQLREKYGL